MTMKNFLNISLLAILLSLLSGCGSPAMKQSINNKPADTSITADIKAAATKDTTVDASQMKVETLNGAVRLSGTVPSHAQVTAATGIARAVAGVTSVNNNMMVKAVN